MSIWTPEPQREGTIPNYHILRTPNTSQITCICLSDQHEGVRLHYWKGRSRPCVGDGCEACINGHVPRWKGYVLVKSPNSPKIVIFEFTERAFEAFEQRRRRHGSLRGCVFDARRSNRKVNGPLIVEFHEARHDSDLLPEAADLRAMLERIWEVRQQTLPGMASSDDDLRDTPELRLA